MPYIGAKQLKASNLKRFSVTGSTSATHVLTWTAPNEQSLIITINGVKQHDGAYTISGSPTTITLSSALVATDEMEVIGINDIGTTITPAQNSVNTDKIADNAVTTAKIADDQITSAKLANAINITSGNSLTIDSGATITNNGTNGGGFGKVLQVVTVHKADNFTTSSTSYVDVTGLSVSITPSSASNKILILGNMVLGISGNHNAFAQLLRGATVIASSTGNSINSLFAVNGNSTAFVYSGVSEGWAYLDSPSTTSSITYKIQIKSQSASYVATVNTRQLDNHLGGSSNITLMEIAG